ncbi:hypothetical protein DXC54_07540 [Bifidobacterium longum]|jgi:hypothetical protein|uniref:Secreted protein n=1 Tax=Bifidobacterium longum TaxID=216816 RepID=A0A3E4S5D7_BIFLN|nr:hypothetical protein [Bifidobacterium longum]QUI45651.1 hypothetical protein I3K77_09925 [Bifidobacterium longum]QUI47657.1 hypothetical protein I3K78_09970 [Bifidobacterium longum]RGL48605.1 hypothetical protein DXC63_06260 [Bifidobacterium longum]RGL65189.1 hypothetical protein DXC54_07540 [Bifidobacterium longum]
MTKTRTTTATSIIPLLLLATACGTPTANPESAAPQTKTQTQTKTEKKPAPEPKKETPAEEKPEEQTPTAPEPATDPTSGEWTETMNSPSDLSGQLDEAWLRCSPQNNPTPELFSWKRSVNHDGVWLHITEGGMDGSVQQACMDSLFGGAKSEPTGEWTEMDLNGISRWQKQDDGAADIIWKSAD